jgi:hypothetical protein
MHPFTFLTIAYRDPAALPDGAESFELLPFITPKEPAWTALAEHDGAKTWAHILGAFSRHRDRKYTVGEDGRILRRSVRVSRSSIVGLGKEGGKYAARLKLGRAAGDTPSVFMDWERWLREAGRKDAERIGIGWGSVRTLQRRLRLGSLQPNGAAVRRLKAARLRDRPGPANRQSHQPPDRPTA